MPDNYNLVPEMRASLDKMTAKISGESKDELVRDYDFSVSSGKPSSKLKESEKEAIDTYEKNLR